MFCESKLQRVAVGEANTKPQALPTVNLLPVELWAKIVEHWRDIRNISTVRLLNRTAAEACRTQLYRRASINTYCEHMYGISIARSLATGILRHHKSSDQDMDVRLKKGYAILSKGFTGLCIVKKLFMQGMLMAKNEDWAMAKGCIFAIRTIRDDKDDMDSFYEIAFASNSSLSSAICGTTRARERW